MTECNRCGECCEDIFQNVSKRRLREIVAYGDPRDDAVWRWWLKGWDQKRGNPGQRKKWVDQYLDAVFILKHWRGAARNGSKQTKGYTCDMFDPVARLCTAYDDRPPVCSNYPWYGREPSVIELHDHCSFWADLPEETWPEPVRVNLRRTKVA